MAVIAYIPTLVGMFTGWNDFDQFIKSITIDEIPSLVTTWAFVVNGSLGIMDMVSEFISFIITLVWDMISAAIVKIGFFAGLGALFWFGGECATGEVIFATLGLFIGLACVLFPLFLDAYSQQ